MTDAKLLPCPFCQDNEPERVEGMIGWMVHCPNCHAQTGQFPTRPLAIRAWNRRSSSVSPSAEAREHAQRLHAIADLIDGPHRDRFPPSDVATRLRAAATFIERTAAPGVTEALEQALWHWGTDDDRGRLLDAGKGWKTDTFVAVAMIRAALSSPKEGGGSS
jgi:hypothetical protein